MNLRELQVEVEEKAVEFLNTLRLDDIEQQIIAGKRLHKLTLSALLNAVRGLHRKRQVLEDEVEYLKTNYRNCLEREKAHLEMLTSRVHISQIGSWPK